jgi:hypothetical protein
VENSLYNIIENHVPIQALTYRNNNKKWQYGYDEKYDIVVISKDGTIGEIYNINDIKIALPLKPEKVDDKNNKWLPEEYPQELKKLKTVFDWNRKDNEFKSKYVDLIEREFDRRDGGLLVYE